MYKRAILLLTLLLAAGCAGADGSDGGAREVAHSGAFKCPDGPMIRVDYLAGGDAIVEVGDRDPLRLPRAISGSGARYADSENEIWEAKGELRVTLADGTKLEGCPRVDS
jgi:membrane-bound inhibitor of C-type lysozyme